MAMASEAGEGRVASHRDGGLCNGGGVVLRTERGKESKPSLRRK